MIFTEKDAEDIYHQVAKDAMKGCYAGDMWEPNVRPADVAKYFNRILAERGEETTDGDTGRKGLVIWLEPADTAESLLDAAIAFVDAQGTSNILPKLLRDARRLLDAAGGKRE